MAIWSQALRHETDTLRVVVLDVGQGDSIFLRTPSGKTVLVDGGGRAGDSEGDVVGRQVVAPFLRREGVNRIDVMVLTHPHDDHVLGLIPILSQFTVGKVLDTGIPHGSEAYTRFLELIENKHIPYTLAVRGQKIDFGDGVRAEVLNPSNPRPGDDANNQSIVLRFTYGKSSLLLAGDADDQAESDMMSAGVNVHSTVLKVAHHGSESATSDRWLDAVRPRVAIISVGWHNQFHHPSDDVIARLRARAITVYRTDQHGAVIVDFTPHTYRVQTILSAPQD